MKSHAESLSYLYFPLVFLKMKVRGKRKVKKTTTIRFFPPMKTRKGVKENTTVYSKLFLIKE